MKIRLLVEGKTETGLRELLARAVNATLDRCCGISIRQYEGVSDLRKKIGSRVEDEIKNSQALVVYCVVDLYHYFDSTDERRTLPALEQAEAVKNDLLNQIDAKYRDRARIFVIIHEIETWMLADADTISKKLKTSLNPFVNLEGDKSYNEPAKFLTELFRTHGKRYNKVKEGVPLLQKADWEKIYKSCKVFKSLVDSLREDCKQ